MCDVHAHANAANVETQKSIKALGGKIREVQSAYEDEQRAKEVTRDHLIAAERKAHSVQNALEEARTLLEQSDRARRLVEQELSDTNETLSELTCQNQAIAGAKRKLDSELQTIHVSNFYMACLGIFYYSRLVLLVFPASWNN